MSQYDTQWKWNPVEVPLRCHSSSKLKVNRKLKRSLRSKQARSEKPQRDDVADRFVKDVVRLLVCEVVHSEGIGCRGVRV